MNRSYSLQKVISTSVIRSTHQGESHGGIYIVDLETENYEQVVDWNTNSISWEGRGADRGLRGISFYDNKIYCTASDEIFVYNNDFEVVESHKNKYLKHCHEIFIYEDKLFITSTGFDSVLEFDLLSKSFIHGYCLRDLNLNHPSQNESTQQANLKLNVFDPNLDEGPLPCDTFHLNNIYYSDGILYFAGANLGALFYIKNNEIIPYIKMPYGNHNACPFKDGVLFNDTSNDQVVYLGSDGQIIESFHIIRYKEEELLMSYLPEDHARQAFGRGLCITDNGLIIGGSSPATISVYQFGCPTALKTVNIKMDVRNSIHGLAIWPY